MRSSRLASAAETSALGVYTIAEVPTLGGSVSEALGLNEVGQVAGAARTSGDAASHAIRWENGTLTDLGTLAGGWSFGLAINEGGQVVGWGLDANLVENGFLWSNGTMQALPCLDTSELNMCGARAINDAGLVAGYSWPDVGTVKAVVWQNGTIRSLGVITGQLDHGSEAFAVNNFGDVAGYSDVPVSGFIRTHAAVWWADGTVQSLGTLKGSTDFGDFSIAKGINDAGQVVGHSRASDGLLHGFLWSSGVLTDLGTLGRDCYAFAVNGATQVVGRCDINDSGDSRATLWQGGVLHDLNGVLPTGSGWVLSYASSINDKGQIVGIGTYNGQVRGFVLSPSSTATPTPTSTPTPTPTATPTPTGVAVHLDVTEAVSVSDSPTARLPVVITVDDTVGVTDAPALQLPLQLTVEEGVGVTDTPALRPSALVRVDEMIGVTDALVDTVPPVTHASATVGTAPYTFGAWTNQDVQVVLSPTDPPLGSGVETTYISLDGGLPQLYDSASGFTITVEGEHTLRFWSVDLAGNLETAQSVTIRIDKTPPQITIRTPSDGAAYLLHQVVATDYACTDLLGDGRTVGSGVATCTGTVATGNPLPTASVGTHTFSVRATDQAGNAARIVVSYTVSYAIQLLYSPDGRGARAVILQLHDAAGVNVSAPDISVIARCIVPHGTRTCGTTRIDAPFTYTATGPPGSSGGAYVYQFTRDDLRGLTRGTQYDLLFNAGNDPLTHAAPFTP